MPIVNVNASQPQHIPAGSLLGKMYYGGFLEKVLSRDEYSGYPHNGGEHTLRLHMPAADLGSFLTLVEEQFGQHPGAKDFVASVKERATKNHPALRLQ